MSKYNAKNVNFNSWDFFIETMGYCVSNGPICHVSLSGDGSVRIQEGPVPSIENMEIDQISVGFYVLEESEFNTIKVVSVSQYFDGPEIKSTTLRADFTNWQSK